MLLQFLAIALVQHILHYLESPWLVDLQVDHELALTLYGVKDLVRLEPVEVDGQLVLMYDLLQNHDP